MSISTFNFFANSQFQLSTFSKTVFRLERRRKTTRAGPAEETLASVHLECDYATTGHRGDDWATFAAPAKIGVLVKALRAKVDELLLARINVGI